MSATVLEPGRASPGAAAPAPAAPARPRPVGSATAGVGAGVGADADRASTSSGWGSSAALLTVVTVAISLGNYAYSFIVVHLMNAENFARFSAAQGLMLVLGSGCMAAIPWAMARFIAEGGDRRTKQEAMHFGLIASALQGLAFAALAGTILWLEAGAAVGIMVALCAFIGSVIAVPLGFLQGIDRMRAITGIRLLEFVVRFGSGVVILLAVSRSAPAALIGYPVGAVVLVAAGLRLCRDGLPPVSGDSHTIRVLVRQSANLGAIQVFLAMLGALDTVAVLAAHLSINAAASYQSAALLGRIPLFFSAAISLAAYVHVVNAGDEGAVRERMGQAGRLFACVVVPFVIVCATVPDALIHVLIPARYNDAVILLRFTAVAGAAVGWIDIVSTAHQARGRFRPAIRILGAAAITQPVALICAGRAGGLWFFAATAVAVAVVAAVVISIDARHWLPRRVPAGPAALTVVALAAAVLLHRSVPAWLALTAVMAAVAVRGLRGAMAHLPTSTTDDPTDLEAAMTPQTETEPEPPRVLILGDSVACGLGVYGQSFGKLAAEQLGAAEVLDLTGISKSVGETLADAAEIAAFAPTLAILGVGTTESLVHPGEIVQKTIERLGPKSWNGMAGLEPRPYFSGDARRRLRQRINSALKVMVKRLVIRLTGGGRRISAEQFGADLTALVALLEQLECPMIFVGMSPVDESLFPGTGRALVDTQQVLERVVGARADAVLLDPQASVRYWDDFLRDRLHLNDSGHQRLAALAVAAAEGLLSRERLGVMA